MPLFYLLHICAISICILQPGVSKISKHQFNVYYVRMMPVPMGSIKCALNQYSHTCSAMRMTGNESGRQYILYH